MADVKPTLGPQAALETALRDLIRATLGYPDGQCQRTLDGRPWPSMGDVFVAVWSEGRRENSQKLSYDVRLGVTVTITLRVKRPFDRQVEDRDDLERRLGAVAALAARDRYDHRIIRKANELAGLSNDPGSTARHAGFIEGLCFARLDAIQPVGPEWFNATGERGGLAQACVCDRARWIQAVPTAV